MNKTTYYACIHAVRTLRAGDRRCKLTNYITQTSHRQIWKACVTARLTDENIVSNEVIGPVRPVPVFILADKDRGPVHDSDLRFCMFDADKQPRSQTLNQVYCSTFLNSTPQRPHCVNSRETSFSFICIIGWWHSSKDNWKALNESRSSGLDGRYQFRLSVLRWLKFVGEQVSLKSRGYHLGQAVANLGYLIY